MALTSPSSHWLLNARDISVPGRLRPLSRAVTAGRRIHIIGPNGAGKSTLLGCLAGLQPFRGELQVLGKPLAAWTPGELARRRGYLPQLARGGGTQPVFHYLRQHQPAAVGERATARAVASIAGRLALLPMLARPLNALSGGEWQRARLAAVMLQVWPTLNTDARLLMLDEPAASLDIAQQVALDQLIVLLTAAGLSMLMCAHDINHTLAHADEVWLMAQGELVAAGAAAEVMTPEQLAKVFGVAFSLVSAGDRRWLVARERVKQQ